jgi:tRNA dimethylallyltransferase
MQVYRQLQIVTARPDASELEQCPHLLYGHRDAAKPYSVAGWLGDAGEVLDELRASGKAAISVGGTGLYFRGLTQGLSPVPSLDPEIRLKWRNFANTDNPASGNVGRSLYDELMARDPAAAKILRPSDHQRLIRALEVIDSTGRSILEWQNDDKGKALISPDGVRKLLLMPERPALHQRINQRFDKMLAQGVLAEVTRFLELGIDPSLPAMKAIGVPQIASYLKGEVSLDEAIEKAKAATRQFAKRQSTWFSNQFGDDWKRI